MTQAPQRFIVHVTTAGERWDLIAWQYYGDATGYSPIIMANPNVAIVPQFGAGVTIAVPILEQSDVIISDLPPWKLAGAVA
ncbi:MAG TPA: tail protein X [Candidatus Acidoferrales bacterium]|nr:tail protein X [Candidatus Acidoferrales bacterium]